MQPVEVLLVQRDLMPALEVERWLERVGCVVIAIASNGIDALDFAERFKPDLAFIDIGSNDEFSYAETAAALSRQLQTPSIYLVDPACTPQLNGSELIDAIAYISSSASDDELRICIERGLLAHRQQEKLIGNLEWHRSKLDQQIAHA